MIDNRERGILYLSIALAFLIPSAAFGIVFGPANGIQIGLIILTIIISSAAYVKQVKDRVEESIERLPRVRTGNYVIKPILFDAKTWPPRFTVIQLKLYEIEDGELSPADMEAFLKEHFENPTEEFEEPQDLALKTNHPSRVNIEWTFLDPEGLRIRTKSFQSTQLRRLAEQAMYKIEENIPETEQTQTVEQEVSKESL